MMIKLLSGLALLCLSSASFADYHCHGSIQDRSIDDNISISHNCQINNATIKGNVMLHQGAQAVISNSSIDGNLESKGRFSSVQAQHNRIDGNIQLESGQTIQLTSNQVDGDIQLKKNTQKITVKDNVIDGNLQCESNRIQPIGGNNRVKGDKEGQCRRL